MHTRLLFPPFVLALIGLSCAGLPGLGVTPTAPPVPRPTVQVFTPQSIPTRTPTLTQSPTQPTLVLQYPAVSRTPVPLVVDEQKIILAQAAEIVQLLKQKDMEKLAVYVASDRGLRFSPYAYVKTTDRIIQKKPLLTALHDPGVYLWGNFDGSGEAIRLTFGDYYRRFVYSADFTSATKVGYNQTLGRGNTLDNSREFYPGANVVEYHFPGFDLKYQGMDWKSLRLVFQKIGQIWYLVGIIHAAWTI